jgi:outer membrane protein assembly factor BamB
MRFSLALILMISAIGCARLEKWGVTAPERERKFFHVRWAKNYDSLYTPGNLPLTYGGVTTSEDIIYVGALDGRFQAIDTENGRILWEHLEVNPIAAPSLVFGEDVFYGTQGGRLIVRQRISGELKYAIDLGAPIESAPVQHAGRLIVYLRGHQIVCLDAATGKIIWNYRRAVPVTVTLQHTTRPLIVGDRVIIGFADGHAGALSLQEGTLLWEQKLVETQKFVDIDLNPILVDGLIVTGSPTGELKALDTNDGSIRRQYPTQSLSHPIVRGQSLIVGSVHGEITFLDFQGKVIKQAKITKSAINQIWWWKDHLVAATYDGDLLAIDPLNFAITDRFSLGHDQSAVFGDSAEAESGLGVLTSRNRLFYFE